MSDQPHDNQVPAQPVIPNPAPAASAGQKDLPPADPPAAKKLTPEEQWELFEKELKETDWGHRPC